MERGQIFVLTMQRCFGLFALLNVMDNRLNVEGFIVGIVHQLNIDLPDERCAVLFE